MTDEPDDDTTLYSERRQRRIQVTAWVTIIALLAMGGGSTAMVLLFG